MDLTKAIIERSSVRSYKNKQVKIEEVLEVLNIAKEAPSSGNIQNWRFIIVIDESKIKEISTACLSQSWMSQAPVHIVICNNYQEVIDNYNEYGKKYSVQNCAIVAQNIMLTATDFGDHGKDTSYSSGLINLANLLNFNINSLLEFDVYFPKVINRNEILQMNVSIIDKGIINYAAAKITYPNLNIRMITLDNSGDGLYTGNFDDTSSEGQYKLDFIINYGANYTSAYSGIFEIVSQKQNLGKIGEVSYDHELNKGDELEISVLFENTNNTPLNVSIELQMLDEGIVDSYTTPKSEVLPLSNHQFEILWNSTVEPGNYSLNIIAHYIYGFNIKKDSIVIKDTQEPSLSNISFSESLTEDTPFILELRMHDDSTLKGLLYITNPEGETTTANISQIYADPERILAGTFYNTAIEGSYGFSFLVCDTFDNCFKSESYNFSIEQCLKDSKILLVKEQIE